MVKPFSFFSRFVNKRRNQVWNKFFDIPQGFVRICLFILHHDNSVSREYLFEKLVNRGFYSNIASCKTIVYRGIDKGILEDNNGIISVKHPESFPLNKYVIKEIRGSQLDNWKALVIPSSVLTVIFCFMSQFFAVLSGIVTVVLILAWFVEDSLYILKD